jgi:hypothetical protein
MPRDWPRNRYVNGSSSLAARALYLAENPVVFEQPLPPEPAGRGPADGGRTEIGPRLQFLHRSMPADFGRGPSRPDSRSRRAVMIKPARAASIEARFLPATVVATSITTHHVPGDWCVVHAVLVARGNAHTVRVAKNCDEPMTRSARRQIIAVCLVSSGGGTSHSHLRATDFRPPVSSAASVIAAGCRRRNAPPGAADSKTVGARQRPNSNRPRPIRLPAQNPRCRRTGAPVPVRCTERARGETRSATVNPPLR